MSTTDPLSAETLARMKAEHVAFALPGSVDPGYCRGCSNAAAGGYLVTKPFPCDAALLLAERERREPPTIAKIMVMEQQRQDIQRWMDQAGIVVTGGWAGPSPDRPTPALKLERKDSIAYGLLGPSTAEELAR